MSTEQQEKQKVKHWIKEHIQDRWDIVFIIALLIGIGIRLYYLNINTAVWWDEGEYLATASHWAFNIPYGVNYHRGILFPFLGAIFLKLRLGEAAIRFFLVFLPSIGSLILTYFLGKKMYNKAVGSIATLIMSTSWVNLFWTARVATDFLGLFFGLATFYYFWTGYVEQKDTKKLIFMGIAAALGFLTRPANLLIPVILGIFLLITEHFKFLKEKRLWYMGIAAIITSLPYLIWNIISFGSPIAFTQGYDAGIVSQSSFAWQNLPWIYQYLGTIGFVFFIIGLITLANFFLGLDLIIKKKEHKLNADLLTVLSIVLILAFFIFYIRSTEDRWLLPLSPFIFLLVGKGANAILEQVKKIKPILIFAGIMGILVIGIYMNAQTADTLIQNKKDSYLQVKLGAEWMKANSNPGDTLLSISTPQTLYYSQRTVLSYSEIKDQQEFITFLQKTKPKYLTISIFEPHPQWIYQFVANRTDLVTPIQGYFMDQAQTKPMLIVYKINT